MVDAAKVLPPDVVAALDAKLATLEAGTTRQLVVVTIPDLQGYDIADYGYQLGRIWGIGQKDQDNGVLLIVAPNERKVRIEVGYGLEPILTDALTQIIIQREILPRFKAGDLPGGVVAGTDALIKQLQLPPEEAARVAQTAAAQRAQGGDEVSFGPGALFWLALIIIFLILAFRNGKRGRRMGGRGPGPIIIWGPGMGGWGGGGGGGGGGGWGGGGFGGGFGGGGGGFGGGGSSGSW